MTDVEDEKHLWINDSEMNSCPWLVNQCLDHQQLQTARDYLRQQSLTECPFHFNQLEALPAETSHAVDSSLVCNPGLSWNFIEHIRDVGLKEHDFHFFPLLSAPSMEVNNILKEMLTDKQMSQ